MLWLSWKDVGRVALLAAQVCGQHLNTCRTQIAGHCRLRLQLLGLKVPGNVRVLPVLPALCDSWAPDLPVLVGGPGRGSVQALERLSALRAL